MPPDVDTLSIYFALLALRQRTPTGVLAARSAIKFLFSVANPDSKSPTDSNRIGKIIQGIGKKFGGIINNRITLTPDQMKEVIQRTLDAGLQLLSLVQLSFACIVLCMHES